MEVNTSKNVKRRKNFSTYKEKWFPYLIDTGADTDILDGLFREGRIDSGGLRRGLDLRRRRVGRDTLTKDKNH